MGMGFLLISINSRLDLAMSVRLPDSTKTSLSVLKLSSRNFLLERHRSHHYVQYPKAFIGKIGKLIENINIFLLSDTFFLFWGEAFFLQQKLFPKNSNFN